MHKYLTLRGHPLMIRRIIEDLMRVYLPYINRKTKKQVGLLQVVPREIKVLEIAFPETSKKDIKKIVDEIVASHNDKTGGVATHWGPFKKDKWSKEGLELI